MQVLQSLTFFRTVFQVISRLLLGTTISVIKLCGRVYVLILGTLLSYTQLAISCMIFPILFLLLYTLMPESPYYLVQTNNLDRALKALRKLSRVTEDNAVIENRLAEIKRNVEYDMQNKTTFWELITKKDHRRALIAIIGIGWVREY